MKENGINGLDGKVVILFVVFNKGSKKRVDYFNIEYFKNIKFTLYQSLKLQFYHPQIDFNWPNDHIYP